MTSWSDDPRRNSIDKKIKVVLISEDQQIAEVMSNDLNEAPGVMFEFNHISSFHGGLSYLDHERVDAVFMDCSPDDKQAIDRLSRLCAHSAIPVVALTRDGSPEAAELALRNGAQDFVEKSSLNPEMLSRIIRYSIERKRTEYSIRERESRLKTVMEQSTDAIVVVDIGGMVQFANPAATYLFGRSLSELMKETLDLPDERTGTVEFCITRSNGTEVMTELTMREIDWQERRALLATFRDVSRWKRAEEELRQRTLQLQRRNEELDAFAHTVAHDLRNPLGVIVGFSEVLEDHHHVMSGDEIKEYLKLIVQAGFKMSNIVDELLVLAGVRKQEDVETGSLNMTPMIVEVRRRLKSIIDEHHAEIHEPESWPLVLGHGPWVEEVWVNYISNAVKHGGRPPRVKLGARIQDDGMVRFWVRDNGPGLTQEQQARLFTPFSRLDQARTKGHGLGLSIVARIMERLGGEFGVESCEGEGCVFYFTLPAVSSVLRP